MSDIGEISPRKRPKPGERRVQILQALASMLEQPGAERITTSGLAAKLDVSEAALYRHFASKAQMFEGLIEFIEQSVFTLVNQIIERETVHAVRVRKLVTMVLQFAEKNPGMTRVMAGDALVFENERLQDRMKHPQAKPARSCCVGQRCNADGRCASACLRCHGLHDRSAAALFSLWLQALAHRAS
jgi:AcrR family transcriptional regulator